jgi:hypothetical protein
MVPVLSAIHHLRVLDPDRNFKLCVRGAQALEQQVRQLADVAEPPVAVVAEVLVDAGDEGLPREPLRTGVDFLVLVVGVDARAVAAKRIIPAAAILRALLLGALLALAWPVARFILRLLLRPDLDKRGPPYGVADG